jgi:hypothetical protein
MTNAGATYRISVLPKFDVMSSSNDEAKRLSVEKFHVDNQGADFIFGTAKFLGTQPM